MIPLFRKRQKEDETSPFFLENGGALLEELMASFGGRYENPIRTFSLKELLGATTDFTERVVLRDSGCMFRGFLGEKQILVKRFCAYEDISPHVFRGPIRDIAVSSQMSHVKNILKLRGCCLELKFPALVYECSATKLLADLLYHPDVEKLLSWKSRMQIAKGIANAIAYLHNAFATPIVYRNLKPSTVILDKDGTPKLFDFSLSVKLPPGKSQVEDVVMGTWGFVDPEHLESGIVTEKTDVYSIGVLLLVLLTGKEAMCKNHVGKKVDIVDYVKYYIDKNQSNNILDPRISMEGNVMQDKQLQAFLDLAMMCTQTKAPNRPDMIQVAKELCKIENCANHGQL
ncbi:serine/threonine-protein kinase ZRK1-like [Coffea arabica]|uniref:Serine/threonine-protein kinase ZRK1-like n=1 Tax=Coffea arabica TaxID=13443 RepID=A0A6P6UYZ3_COFAR|nr:non-functional pseudokinase ZED1-like [Coffea arabica]XP_027094801.1 non-functional pseudokinase ZED1-like [Coffea arabica]XP_027094802.1 non-functional pseudokinase ZED1-like [Coffea arabica]